MRHALFRALALLAFAVSAVSLPTIRLGAQTSTNDSTAGATRPPTAAGVCTPGRVALVLAGGGSKGIAHVGVIQHLDSLGIVPDLVVGTSIGALVGAMYASGWDAKALEEFVFRFNVGRYIGGYAPSAPRALGPVLPLLTWNEGAGGGLDFSTSTVREGNVNLIASAMLLAGNLRAAGDFDRLPTPFRAVATDLRTGNPIVLRSGDLAEAVRASFAIPLVFQPLTIEKRVLVDGGMAENAPVGVARAEGASRVILSEMTDTVEFAVERSSTSMVAASLMRFLFSRNRPQLRDGDVRVTSNTTGTSALDFSDATMKLMIERGREAARRAIPTAECLPTTRRVVADLPPLAARRFTERPTGAEQRLSHIIFGDVSPNEVSLDSVMTRIVRVSEGERVTALWLNPERVTVSRPSSEAVTGADSVLIHPRLVFAPRRSLSAGLVYDGELGGRAWLGAVDRHPIGWPVEIASRGALGRYRQDVIIGLRRNDQYIELTRSPFLEATIARERVRLFLPEDRRIEIPDALLPAFSDQKVRVGIEQPLGHRWTLQAAGLARRVTTLEIQTDSGVTEGFDDRALSVFGGTVSFVRVRSDPRFVPRVDLEYTNRYTRLQAVTASTFTKGLFDIAMTSRVVWADRELPFMDTPTLGGEEGFPGLRIFEQRGMAELSSAVEVSRPIVGPLALQFTVQGGQVAENPHRPVSGEWLAGARVGLGAATPIGPLRVQYGVNSRRDHRWFVRIGRWF
ncbi:MAG TPA: patatin-like phospholipase family protein [Gemmatimonas sp.]|uniref:patatin-like phospholipase family protein n=1 Tax=Gemmatimonas sp. TaxID=1962908 RepID=UPI002ED97EC4